MRKHSSTFIVCSVLVLCLIFFVSHTSSQPVRKNLILDKSQANQDIIEMYQQLINLHQRDLTEKLRLLEFGRGNLSGLAKTRTKLSKTRIRLAKFQGKHELVVKELRNIVQYYTKAREQLKREVEKGQKPSMYLNRIEIALLESEIRLAKATQ